MRDIPERGYGTMAQWKRRSKREPTTLFNVYIAPPGRRGLRADILAWAERHGETVRGKPCSREEVAKVYQR